MTKISLFIAIFLSLQSVAGEVKLGTYLIPLMVESETEGKFITMSNILAKRSNLNFKYIIAPPKRTIENYFQEKLDCFFPALDVLLKKPVFKSQTVYLKKDFIFMNGHVKNLTLIDLVGKKVGLTLGYPYAEKVTKKKGIHFEYARSDILNIKKLISGRIDYFIVEERSGAKAASIAGQGLINYNSDNAISVQKVYYGCHSQKTAKKLSRAITSIKKDGTLLKLFIETK
jgi:ABC-type amino acid transport substrate-binding protein